MKTGRNDPCPCGSGRKYKKCCLYKEVKSGRSHRKIDYLGTYMDFKHLFGAEPNNRILLKNDIESFDLDVFLQVCLVTHFWLGNWVVPAM